MKIYSWNMLYRNLEQDRAFDYISRLDFDVLCLQEVPEEFLERLSTLDLRMVSTIDVILTRGAESKNLQHVILTQHPIRESSGFPMPLLTLKWRSTALLKIKEGYTKIRRRESLYADIEFPGGLYRVFSLHLSPLSPETRAGDFDVVATYIPVSRPVILTGDFNIVDHPFTKPFGWFFGASVRESLPWSDERGEMEARFKALGVENPLRRKTTLAVTLSQLDHILVPATAPVLRAEVIKDTYGSDHNPIFVELGT